MVSYVGNLEINGGYFQVIPEKTEDFWIRTPQAFPRLLNYESKDPGEYKFAGVYFFVAARLNKFNSLQQKKGSRQKVGEEFK